MCLNLKIGKNELIKLIISSPAKTTSICTIEDSAETSGVNISTTFMRGKNKITAIAIPEVAKMSASLITIPGI